MTEFEQMSEDERREWWTNIVAGANAGMQPLEERADQEWRDFVDALTDVLFT
tara:strand:- start:1325 stop:1480 length:156 start_codon:yes stop_codon:yes gene_type:complete